MKRTMLGNGPIMTIYGHFSINNIKAFMKLRIWRSFWCAQSIQILIGSKAMTQITIFVLFPFPQFCKKKKWKFTTHKWPFYDHFWSFFSQLHRNLSQNWGSDGLFEVLGVFVSYLNQKLCQKLFFSCLKMHHFRASLPKWV